MFINFFLPHKMFLGFKDSPRKLLQLDRDICASPKYYTWHSQIAASAFPIHSNTCVMELLVEWKGVEVKGDVQILHIQILVEKDWIQLK